MSQDEAPSPEAHAAKVGRYFCSQMPCGPSDCTFPCRYMQDAIATRNNRDPEAIRAAEPKENTSMRIKIVPVPEVEMPGPRADARLEGAKMIREALEEARIVITTCDDVERDLGGNDKEQRAVYNSAIEKIDAALLAITK